MQTLLRLALLTGMLLARTAAGEPAPHVVGDPRHPGPDLPPRGQSLLDELYARDDGTHALPFPFEALLHDLRSRVAPGEITTVLIPLGRSLQRHAAWPDYFAAPRIVAAVTSDPGRPRGPWLQDRLYLGFHPLAEVIEVLSWNEGAGRFEFQVVESYRPGAEPRVEYADRATCVICHQSQSPIFATPLWSETNANPAVAQRLAALGEHYHGVPVEGSVDRADALDRSTDRAFHLTFAGWLWREACAATGDGPACRGGLLLEALAFRLRGDRDASRPEPKARQLAAELTEALASGAPAGVVAISPDLPNRDPLEAILAGTDPFDAVEAAGVHAPEVPRPAIPLWTPDPPPARTLKMAVRELAAQFADRDVQELDRELRSLADGAGFEPVRIPCRIDRAERNDRRGELRLDCKGPGRQGLSGYLVLEGARVSGGRVQQLWLGEHGSAPRLKITGGSAEGSSFELELAEAGLGLAPRLADDRRLLSVRLLVESAERGAVELALGDDQGPLRAAVRRMVEAAELDPKAALGGGALSRRAILAELDLALAG